MTIMELIRIARNMRERLGPDAVSIVEQRELQNAQEGDREAADFWRNVGRALRELMRPSQYTGIR